MKSVELALSMCDIVDIYGFTVDPGYTEWLVSLLESQILVLTEVIITNCFYSWFMHPILSPWIK